ncbi:MAG: hypothetical protein NWE93_01865 [Candidatus Bathyarchaeota archaeon]|nr:hypothetical protein [Candidatus Bathyarchaeota archaeon]
METAKHTAKALHELTDTYVETYHAIKTTAKDTANTKKLWREGNKSSLIKIGVACIVFPDPSPVGEIIGAGFLVAGAVQTGIRNRAAYVGDIKKNIEGTLKEINRTNGEIRI